MAKDQALLCVALDAMEPEKAVELAKELGSSVDIIKIGLGLFNRGGLDIVKALVDTGASVFLDLKLHDIPSQVGDAVGAITKLGVHYLTVHTGGGGEMLAAAVEQRNAASAQYAPGFPKLLGVTVLTSLGPENLREVGAKANVEEVVRDRVKLAHRSGIDGIVCSPADLDFINEIPESQGLLKVTPGIRPPNYGEDDQNRVATPGKAVAAGANVLVVGRPIKLAENPKQAAEGIRKAMESSS